MSSPFKIFRKHQKVLLVVAGLMAMIAFVVLPIVLQNFSVRQGGADPVVVSTTKYGDITQSGMQNLRARHERVLGILTMILSKVNSIDPQLCREYLERPQMFGGSKEEDSVNRWLMAHKADELGMNVSNETITNFIKEQSSGKLSLKDFQGYVKQYGGDRYTEQNLFDDLSEELKVQEFRNIYAISVTGVPPGQRWDYYCRTQQQATIECIPVPVAKFAATNQKPSDKELEAYFEKYKDKVQLPDASEPGFRVPQKIEIEYFTANVDKFAAPENVTDDEIQTYYEKDPKNYDKMNKQAIDREAKEAAAKKELEEKESSLKDAAKKASPENGKPAEETKPAEDAKPAEGGAPPAAPEGEKKDGEKKDGEQTAPPPADKPADKPAEKSAEKPADSAEQKTSSVERSPYRFASLQADENKDPDRPKTETPKADAPAAGGEAAASKP